MLLGQIQGENIQNIFKIFSSNLSICLQLVPLPIGATIDHAHHTNIKSTAITPVMCPRSAEVSIPPQHIGGLHLKVAEFKSSAYSSVLHRHRFFFNSQFF